MSRSNGPRGKPPKSWKGLGLVRDASGKTEAYFWGKGHAVVDKRVLRGLKEKLASDGLHTVRLCLHSGAQADFHEMIILHRRGGIFTPHKHQRREESYHMIEGAMRIHFYDRRGRRTDSKLIGAPGTGLPILCRIRTGVWHATVPETEFAVFHESRPGPFDRRDTVLADWGE